MRILVADDDVDDRTLASLAFSELDGGHELEFVADGQQLIDHLSMKVKNNMPLPDLVLLDLNMPRKDGRTALKEIKQSGELRGIDIVIFSTSSSPEDVEYTTRMGASGYHIKPSDYSQLLDFFKLISTGHA